VLGGGYQIATRSQYLAEALPCPSLAGPGDAACRVTRANQPWLTRAGTEARVQPPAAGTQLQLVKKGYGLSVTRLHFFLVRQRTCSRRRRNLLRSMRARLGIRRRNPDRKRPPPRPDSCHGRPHAPARGPRQTANGRSTWRRLWPTWSWCVPLRHGLGDGVRDAACPISTG